MSKSFGARAGALGGLAAGVVLLAASVASADEPAANGGLRAVDSSGRPVANLRLIAAEPAQLKPIGLSLGQLKPLQLGSAIRLPPISGAWNPSPSDPLTCLAQAVYFEARSESEAGQKAVAQVVMNRTGLARYADTVCGVVYQGWERATGCQFTFVCDGSLKAPDDAAAWDRAIEVAKNALAGIVFKPMLGATHYHAAWMRPYWAGEYTRIGRVGDQIFYH